MKGLFSSLTKRELVQLLELTHASSKVRSENQLIALLNRVTHLIPCANIIACLGEIDKLTRFKQFIKMINPSFPPEWVTLYLERGYGEVDPILRSHFGRFQVQIWSDTYRKATSPRELEFIAAAGSFGLSEGITMGVACPRNNAGSVFSFVGSTVTKDIRHQSVLEYIVPHLHLAMMATSYTPVTADPTISEREREVLEWMKEGKTSWEISKILIISERTVNFHVQNILTKLQASTRGHAIALALQQGLIGP